MNLLAHLSLLAMSTMSRSGSSSSNASSSQSLVVSNSTVNANVITPDLATYVEATLQQNSIPGLAIGFVRLNNGSVTTEFGAWGNMTEDGSAVVPEVSPVRP